MFSPSQMHQFLPIAPPATHLRCLSTSASQKEQTDTFQGVGSPLLQNLRNMGVTRPTEIQRLGVAMILNDENVVINSETGTGKTLAYALPLVERIFSARSALSKPSQALVLVPTNELAYQVQGVFTNLLRDTPLQCRLVLPKHQLIMNADTAVLVATPAGLAEYKLQRFQNVRTVVIDEADVLLQRKLRRKEPMYWIMDFFSEGRAKQVYYEGKDRYPGLNQRGRELHSKYGRKENDGVNGRQFIFVGATIADKVKDSRLSLLTDWCSDVQVVRSQSAHQMLSNIQMETYELEEGNKMKTLVHCINSLQENRAHVQKIMVFVNSLKKANQLHKSIVGNPASTTKQTTNPASAVDLRFKDDSKQTIVLPNNFYSDLLDFHRVWRNDTFLLHSDMPSDKRLHSLREFALSDHAILVTTDTVARGIDVQNVNAVIQYDFATNIITSVHRAGRTGRMGREGTLISFVTESERHLSKLFHQYSYHGVSLEPIFSHKQELKKHLQQYGFANLMQGAEQQKTKQSE